MLNGQARTRSEVSSMDTLRVVIVDDERLARDELRFLLASFPNTVVVGEADGVETGIEAIAQYEPDVIFLDLQLRGDSGLRLLEYCTDASRIVFVTGFEEQALLELEQSAHVYLLKPINPARLDSVMEDLVDN